MATHDFIINVNEASFEYEVITFSQNKPVVVDFWATWCKPCKVTSPMLEQLAVDAGGAFRLARLDVDDNPNLALRFSVRTLPTIKVFSDGQVAGELVGLVPEPRLREFLAHITPPSPANLLIEKGNSLLSMEKWQVAEQTFHQALEMNPEQATALLGLSRALLAQGKADEVATILREFPASRQFAEAELLKPLMQALLDYRKNALPDITDLDAAYRNCIRLAGRSNLPAALDGLLDILRQDRHYLDGQVRQVAVGILEVMGEDNPLTRQYRSELASILF